MQEHTRTPVFQEKNGKVRRPRELPAVDGCLPGSNIQVNKIPEHAVYFFGIPELLAQRCLYTDF